VGSSGASAYAPAEVIAQFVESLAHDTDQFMNLSVTGTGLTGATVYTASGTSNGTGTWTVNSVASTEAAALAAIRAGTAAMALSISMQTFSQIYAFCNVNPKYFKQRQIAAVPSLTGGSCAWADFEETVATIYEEGRGYDIQELEYIAEGFLTGPYRQSNLNGLPFMNAEFIASKDLYYTVCVFAYDQFSVGGWQEYLNNLSTYFVLDGESTAGDSAPATTAGYPKAVLNSIAKVQGITEVTV